MRGIVISLVATVARKFMYDRHADLYLGSKRDDFGWCETTPQYLRCNFNYVIICKARTRCGGAGACG